VKQNFDLDSESELSDMVKMFNYTINNLAYIKSANRSDWHYNYDYNGSRHRDMDHNRWNDT